MSNQISTTINKLTGEGFVLVSTDIQMKKGTLIFKDLFQEEVQYAIYGESGYVRKRNVIVPIKPSPWYSGNRWWQLNPTNKTPYGTWGGYTVERILMPNDYEGMANIILRVAKKSRIKSIK